MAVKNGETKRQEHACERSYRVTRTDVPALVIHNFCEVGQTLKKSPTLKIIAKSKKC